MQLGPIVICVDTPPQKSDVQKMEGIKKKMKEEKIGNDWKSTFKKTSIMREKSRQITG